jgi:hypothetical protein
MYTYNAYIYNANTHTHTHTHTHTTHTHTQVLRWAKEMALDSPTNWQRQLHAHRVDGRSLVRCFV